MLSYTQCVVHRIYAGALESVAQGMFRSINCMYLLCLSIGVFSLVKQEIPMVICRRLQQIISVMANLELVQLVQDPDYHADGQKWWHYCF